MDGSSMTQAKPGPLKIYKELNRSNCGDCGIKTCFAFASLVSQGQKNISECPHLGADKANHLVGEIEKKKSFEEEQEALLKGLESQVSEIDFHRVVSNLGGLIRKQKLVIKCLGKDFLIDKHGHVSSEIHVHSWIKGPLLNYIIRSTEVNPRGKWIAFKELPSGVRWHPLYRQRCEKVLLKVADENTSLFSDVVGLFGKKMKITGITADRITIHYPLPKLPILICYTLQENGFDSNLTLYYDENAEEIVTIESIYSLVVGMTIMIEKIMRRHG
jgi:hypothetical protein